nr:unnamed protein product [Callosobruchus chinensis]
MGRLLFAP